MLYILTLLYAISSLAETVRLNPEKVRLSPETVRLSPETVRLNPETVRLNPETVQLNPETGELTGILVRVGDNIPPVLCRQVVNNLQVHNQQPSNLYTFVGMIKHSYEFII